MATAGISSRIEANGHEAAKKQFLKTLLWIFAFLGNVELALQIRAHLRYGQSVFNFLIGATTYEYNKEIGVKLLRPSTTIGGADFIIRSNSIGLRGPEIPLAPVTNELRIALLGASTIMGTYARDNSKTSSAQLERLIKARKNMNTVRVINAGIAGLTIRDQIRLFERLLVPLSIDMVIWYPGANDIGCKNPVRERHQKKSNNLPYPVLPNWILSYELLTKNTSWLRANVPQKSRALVPDFDPDSLRSDLMRLIEIANREGIKIILSTSARSFTSALPEEERRRRASSALHFRPCYTVDSLLEALDRFNETIRDVAHSANVTLLDAATLIPADVSYFGDTTHFSEKGEILFAELALSAIERVANLH
ncbi:SGNH/GDSL hydrolase family protein [Pelomicrobium sp. G1]|uniref:SGNH/GDSL hydrolase family protein n=1 Tax=unclassified Pelomicrobium TaxID=2815318 RepID=UPI003F75971E